ncbi:MAG TPA: oxidoreductase [Bacteroidia bacterium]|nr:oxidoreductase [Bacteroidia bacterium]
MQKILFFLIGFIFVCENLFAQKEFQIDTFRLESNSNLRGLSVVNNDVIWVSGNNGFVALSTDGGKKWSVKKIPDADTSDFRDIEGFDDKTAIVMNSGTPTVFLKTTDGGLNWKVSYKNDDKKIFFNGMDFWDEKRGIAFSDPIDGKLFLIATNDGGKSWKEIPYKDCPQVQEGEAGFAASGTSIRVTGEGYAYIGTGGKAAHLFSSDDFGRTWKKFSCPIIKFKETTGIFSIAFKDLRTGVVVGGDYASDTLSKDNCYLTFSGGKNWKLPFKSPTGYHSCVEYITQTYVIATGTAGTDISYDGGQTWNKLNHNFNVVRKAKRGTKVFLAGHKGTMGVLEYKK